jgi:hypothetical protein
MLEFQNRRSCRVALSLPIRVFGVDYRGKDFTEDALTIVVNLHGAKIRMNRQLLPESEIRLVSATGQDAVFRVVSKLQGSNLRFTYWGIEKLEPGKNFWGVEIPELRPEDQPKVRVTLQCPSCSARESEGIDENLLISLQEKGGVERTCASCKSAGTWKLPPFNAT